MQKGSGDISYGCYNFITKTRLQVAWELLQVTSREQCVPGLGVLVGCPHQFDGVSKENLACCT